MNQSFCLTKEELQELTGFKYPRKQIEALIFMGVKFRVRPDGTPAVLHSDLTPEKAEEPPKRRPVEPRFDLI